MLNCCTVVVVVAVAVVVVVVVVTTILCESCCCDYSCICKCCTVVCCCYCCCCVRYRCCCLVCFVVFFIVVVVSCVVVFFIAVVVSLSFWGLAMRDFVDLVDFSQKTKALSHSPSLSIPLSLSLSHVAPGNRVNFGWCSTGVLSDEGNQSCPGWQAGGGVGLPAALSCFAGESGKHRLAFALCLPSRWSQSCLSR